MVRIINHSLGGVKETRVIGCEAYFEEQMEKEAQKHCQAATLYYSYESLPRILIETVLIIFIVLFISISQIVSGDNSQDFISVLGVFAVGSIRLIPSASQFVQALAQMRSHSYTLEMLYLDLKEIEQLKPQQMSLKAKTKLLNPAYQRSQTMKFFNKVELSNITYTYPGTSEPSIQGISLNLEKGKSIALIGKSGAGKTTLVDVILGLLEPQYGDIKVDDLSIYNTIRGWQNLIGYIPQSISLIDDTIKRNIAFGVPDIFMNHDSLHKAIEAAQLGELISQLPDGLQTQVGERGIRLSGGQRQRIGIARALYFQREILVLDEATSALDNETESLVTEAIRNLSGTKTMIIIAHRLTTVKHCDEIYMLEKGRIIKSGTYEEVVSSQKIYS
jgi:ABC-type multidrug transport system fused ATPase/permease subunit